MHSFKITYQTYQGLVKKVTVTDIDAIHAQLQVIVKFNCDQVLVVIEV